MRLRDNGRLWKGERERNRNGSFPDNRIYIDYANYFQIFTKKEDSL